MGSALYWMGTDVHGPHYGWSMRQASAMLLVPDSFWVFDLFLEDVPRSSFIKLCADKIIDKQKYNVKQ